MLTDINSDFGLNGEPFEVTGDYALMNLIKNLARSIPDADRFEYMDIGLTLESTLKEPVSEIRGREVFMMIIDVLRYNLPNVTLDTSRSTVTPNYDSGEYDFTMVLNGTTMNFSL